MAAIKKLFVFALVLSVNFYFAQLTGTAFLTSQSNHAGIKVKFLANPGTAVTDSTLTDASGNYSINITIGSYNVSYSKVGYQTTYYSGNTAQLLTNTVTLNSVTLIVNNFVTISGNVTGTLVNTNIYIVDNPLNVANGTTLTIEPGTVIRFDAFHPFNVYGKLYCQGTPTNKVLFTSNKTTPADNDWVGINLYSPNAVLNNCIIEYANYGVTATASMQVIENIEVRNVRTTGINIQGSGSAARYNKVHDCYTAQGSGIAASGGTNTIALKLLVECNEVYNLGNQYYGIGIYGRALAKNNICHDVNMGIHVGGWADTLAVAHNNILKNCGNGIIAGGNVVVTNNTIHNNTTGLYLEYSSITAKAITNNIIVNNYNGIERQGGAPTPSAITHNLVWNNNTNYLNVGMPGIGQLLATNANSDPCDVYYNIDMDPNFAGGIPPNLNSGSPCFGAGDLAYSPNIGCDPNFICSSMVGIKELLRKNNIKVYPNPFEDYVIVKVSTEKVSVSIKDIVGKDIKLSVTNISNDELKVETTGLSRGIYFLTLTDGSATNTVKLIKN